jgi:hypothetical protein
MGKYLISDHPMTIEQWAAERATVVNEVIDDTVGESATRGLDYVSALSTGSIRARSCRDGAAIGVAAIGLCPRPRRGARPLDARTCVGA